MALRLLASGVSSSWLRPAILCAGDAAVACCHAQPFASGISASMSSSTSDRGCSSNGASCSTSSGWAVFAWAQQRSFASLPVVTLSNLKDNDKATKKRIRVGRGNGGRRGNYCGRGMNGHNSRGRGPHLLYDGGQFGLLKFPIVRQRPPYQVLFTQLGLSTLLEYIQLGLLPSDRVITMKDLQDAGCVGRIKYGVLLYGKMPPPFPIHIQVTACDPDTKAAIEAAGGTVTRVYYEEEGLKALLHPSAYSKKNLPLPLPAHSWHPRYNGLFDSIGQLPPATQLPQITQQTAAVSLASSG